ncbi:MAG: efflux RND transporter periplasmic adaptor subunit [Gemmataceae bacterium]
MVSSFSLGCARPNTPTPEKPAAKAAAARPIVTPQQRALRRVIEQPGTIQAFEETPLYAKISGYVTTVKADMGDRVTVGQVLAEISVPELEEEGHQKEALVKQAETGIEQAKKAEASSKASIETAEAAEREAHAGLGKAQANYDRWESESRRVNNLVKDHVIDEQTRDETTNQFRAAEGARNEAQARVASAEAQIRKAKAEQEKASADVRGAQARHSVAEADLRRVQAMLQYTKIRAPFAGVVTRRTIDIGHLLQPGTGKGEAIYTITRVDPVRVFVDVPESDAGLIADGTEAKILVQALGGAERVGRVTRTSWALQPGSRTLRTEIDLPNSNARLRPGMYVYAHLTVTLPAAWTLPVAALQKQSDDTMCYRVIDGKAVRTAVLVGQTDGEFTQALKWRTPGTSAWQDWHGDEPVVGSPMGIADGQIIQ